jgi:hypothetical protein
MVIGYNDLLVFVQSMLPQMRLTRQRNLALVVVGLLQVRDAHLTISEIARAIPNKSDHWYKLKRLWRFLSNLKWSPTECCHPLLHFVLARFRAGQYLPIIFDQSTLAGKWEVLWASIPFRGRALPIYFTLFRYADISHDPEGSQNKIENEFIRAVVDLVPTTLTPLLLFDRGYARVSLLQFLATLPGKYVIRARKNVTIRYRRRFTGLLADVPIHRGQLLWWPKTLYHQEAAYPVNLAISWNAVADEPWYLLTNLRRSDTTVHWYERRFRCEELFKDIKDQLHLETIQIKNKDRIQRLIFSLMVAYYALILMGVAAQSAGLGPKVCKDPVSPAWMALRLLKMPIIFKPRLARRALLVYSWSLIYESG